MDIKDMNTKKVHKMFKRSMVGDYDNDGVINAFDSNPKSKKIEGIKL